MIGDRVKELRNLKKLTQKELASILGLKSQTTITAIEKNKNNPSNEILGKIADYFKVSTDFLLGKTDKDGGHQRLLLASKLKEKMTNENLSIEDIAKKINISQKSLIGAENGEYIDILDYSDIFDFLEIDKDSPIDYFSVSQLPTNSNSKIKFNVELDDFFNTGIDSNDKQNNIATIDNDMKAIIEALKNASPNKKAKILKMIELFDDEN